MTDKINWIQILAVGFILFIAAIGLWKQNQRNILIAECQKELPRNQYCELIAVPINKPRD